MKKISSMIAAAAMVATTFSVSALPAQAQNFSVQIGSGYQQDRGHRDRGRFERRGNYGYYNGHRGYRDRRPGYRQYNGFWFPPAAFAFGAIVGGIIASQADRGGVSNANWNRHVAWCYDRYRSYRESDNTFQPYNGPRQACRSPYY
ncbi:BA14K family protein [Arsenicitalea aurantiaca]|uniref:Lectin-like protein BA14k n=1 Tax=Arsenicitalea aurantiaca TaxID=1783274 RepID=A0A433X5U4_9HYPH|nr:BA14K family protein [Arsenicitalea aurantiaca]RUT29418.1 BA14K family protein [Arsenicitalea aurantiaca]